MRLISVLYFLLLAYMVTSLLFWGHSLNKQSETIYHHEMFAIRSSVDSAKQPELFNIEAKAIKERENRRKRQYLGEGATFLIIILIGAGVVYSSIRSNVRLSRQQTNFILSVTHELKSPIAAIKLNLQTLTKRKPEEPIKSQLLDRSIRESNRLDDLCNNLLLASQMENRHFNPGKERFNFSELLRDSVQLYRIRAKHLFDVEISNDYYTMGDKFLWQLAINNLLENAVKYSPADTSIKVVLSHIDEELCLSIEDQGQGIPDEEKRKVFKKFYRTGNESSRKSKGTGLGLFLATKIIHKHKGTISVRDNEPKGTVFDVVFPAA